MADNEKNYLSNRDMFEKVFGFSDTPSEEWWEQECNPKEIMSTLAHNIIQLCLLSIKIK